MNEIFFDRETVIAQALEMLPSVWGRRPGVGKMGLKGLKSPLVRSRVDWAAVTMVTSRRQRVLVSSPKLWQTNETLIAQDCAMAPPHTRALPKLLKKEKKSILLYYNFWNTRVYSCSVGFVFGSTIMIITIDHLLWISCCLPEPILHLSFSLSAMCLVVLLPLKTLHLHQLFIQLNIKVHNSIHNTTVHSNLV